MRVLAILMMLAAASSAGVARKARVRGGTEARVLAEAGRPASGSILSLSVNMGNKPCLYDATADTTLATRARVAALAPGDDYPYTVVVLQTQESDGGDAMMDAFARALHVPPHQGEGDAWRMVAQNKGTNGFNTRQRVYYKRNAVSAHGATHGKYIGQADLRFTAKNFLLRTLTMADAPGGQQSTCTLDIISTHLPMDSNEKSGDRAGYTVRLNEIAELQAWRAGGGWKRNINTGNGAAILSGAPFPTVVMRADARAALLHLHSTPAALAPSLTVAQAT